MTSFTVASVLPDRLNIHGDAENAAVLAVRAGWRGLSAAVHVVRTPADATIDPDVIAIGSGFDADALEILGGLRALREQIAHWVSTGVPLLAVGLSWELLSASVEFLPGTPTPGLGIFSGRATTSPRRVGTIAVESDHGLLVGYEYHLRDYTLGPDERPLGRVRGGTGNGDADGGNVEGAVRGTAYGTGLRGPVLARNPALADHLIDIARARRALPDAAADDRLARADAYASKANAIVTAEMRPGA